MRSSSTKLSALLLTLTLSTAILALPVLAMDRERLPRDPDNPIVRVIHHLLKKLHLTTAEEIGVPKP